MYLVYALWRYLCLSNYLYYPLILKWNQFNNIISLSLRGYPGVFNVWHIYSLCNAHTWVLAHMMLSIGKMFRNGIQHHAPTDDPDSLIRLLFILLCGLVWFYAYKCYMCLLISAQRLWEWLMILTLFARLT